MRRRVTRRLTQIQPVWNSDNSSLTLSKIEALRKLKQLRNLADNNLFGGCRVKCTNKQTPWTYCASLQRSDEWCLGWRGTKKSSDFVWIAERLTLSPPNKFSSAKFLICFNFQSALMSLKVGGNVVWLLNSLDPGEMPSYSASHLDPSCLHMALWLWLAGLGLINILLKCKRPKSNKSA